MNLAATSSESPSRRAVLAAGIVGILASVLVGGAEFSLHFTPSLDYGGPEYEFFLGTSAARLTLGHFLAIFSVPLYFVGYWHIYHRLEPAPRWARLLLSALGIYSFALGAVWIGSRVYPAILVQAREAAGSDALRDPIDALLQRASFYNETILIGLRIGILALSAIFVGLVSSGKTSYPRWFAALNPILLVLACFLIYFLAPSIGGYLMPIAMNVAHFILFSTSTWLLIRESKSR